MTIPLLQKKILVTGGSGSIGKEIVKKCLSEDASFVRVFSNDENGLYEAELEFPQKNIEYIEADFLKADTLDSIPLNFDTAFSHTLKHN